MIYLKITEPAGFVTTPLPLIDTDFFFFFQQKGRHLFSEHSGPCAHNFLPLDHWIVSKALLTWQSLQLILNSPEYEVYVCGWLVSLPCYESSINNIKKVNQHQD